jgi:hypothetical protein
VRADRRARGVNGAGVRLADRPGSGSAQTRLVARARARRRHTVTGRARQAATPSGGREFWCCARHRHAGPGGPPVSDRARGKERGMSEADGWVPLVRAAVSLGCALERAPWPEPATPHGRKGTWRLRFSGASRYDGEVSASLITGGQLVEQRKQGREKEKSCGEIHLG